MMPNIVCRRVVTRYLPFVVACILIPCNLTQASLLIAAHRGNSSVAPENTIASIQAAAGIAHLSEMDVRVTEDGQLILLHDSSLNRTTDGRGAVRRKTLDELRTLDAGSWFSSGFAGELIPTLEASIDAALAIGIQPLIERKAGAAATYHDQFLQMNLDASDFRVISFHGGFIEDLNDLNPDYQLGILGGGGLNQARLNRLAAQGADFLSWRHTSVNQAIVDLVHANGMELHVWTVNSPARMQQLIQWGVDGITTDYPAILRDLLPPENLMAASSNSSFAMFPASASGEMVDFQAPWLIGPSVIVTVPEPVILWAWIVGWLICIRRRSA